MCVFNQNSTNAAGWAMYIADYIIINVGFTICNLTQSNMNIVSRRRINGCIDRKVGGESPHSVN